MVYLCKQRTPLTRADTLHRKSALVHWVGAGWGSRWCSRRRYWQGLIISPCSVRKSRDTAPNDIKTTAVLGGWLKDFFVYQQTLQKMSQFDYPTQSSGSSSDFFPEWRLNDLWCLQMLDAISPAPDNALQNAQNNCEFLLRFADREDTDRH